MGIADKHPFMEEAPNWPAEGHFHKRNRRGTRRSRSPSREVSPVPSHYSEPLSFRKHKDVTARLPCLINEADHQPEDENDDIQSFKSLPTMTNTSMKVKTSHTKGQRVSDLSLPLLVTSKCTLVVKGTGCTRDRGFLPAIKSMETMDRPPCRAGCRPIKVETSSTLHPRPVGHLQYDHVSELHPSKKLWNIKASCQALPSSCSNKVSLGPRITFQSPVVQGVFPITPDLMKEPRHNMQACQQPLRPVLKLKRAEALNRGTLQCLLEERFLPCSNNPRFLEPFSGFAEHLCHQLVNSPLPCRATVPHVNSHRLLQLEAMLPVPGGLGRGRTQRTVQLCKPQKKQVPCITMTRPTPSPKHLRNTKNRM